MKRKFSSLAIAMLAVSEGTRGVATDSNLAGGAIIILAVALARKK